MSKEAMRQALEALTGPGYYDTTQQREAIKALRAELANPKTGWMPIDREEAQVVEPVAELTDAEIHHLWDTRVSEPSLDHPLDASDKISFARAVIAEQARRGFKS